MTQNVVQTASIAAKRVKLLAGQQALTAHLGAHQPESEAVPDQSASSCLVGFFHYTV